jgi:hypothetical protein
MQTVTAPRPNAFLQSTFMKILSQLGPLALRALALLASPAFAGAAYDVNHVTVSRWIPVSASQALPPTEAAELRYECNTPAGAVTVSLPTAVPHFNTYRLKKTDNSANSCTFATTTSQTSDGALTKGIVAQNSALAVAPDNPNLGVTAVATTLPAVIATDSGADAYVLTSTMPTRPPAPGQLIQFVPAHASSSASTIAYDGASAIPIVNQYGNAVTGGELSAPTWLQYTGSFWQIVGTGPTFDKARSAIEISNSIVPTNYNYDPGNVLRYGADPTGAAASDTAFASAVKAVCPVAPSTAFGGKVKIPAGTYLLTHTWNLTNSRVKGTSLLDGLVIEGDNMRFTQLIGQTGSGNAIIETTGSQFLTIRDLGMKSGVSNKSTIGILQAVSNVLQETQNQRYERMSIILHDDAKANSGVGTVGIWNFGSEENTYDNPYIVANVPLVWTSSNDGTQPGGFAPTSYQTPLLANHSLTLTTFTGEAFLQALNRRNAAVIIQNIDGFVMTQGYIAGNGVASGTNHNAIYFMGNAGGFHWNGDIEELETIWFDGGISTSEINILWGGITNTSAPAIRVNRTKTSAIETSKISINLQSSTRRIVLTTNDGNESSASSYSISNTNFYASTASGPGTADLHIPLNVAQNAGSVNIGVYGGAGAAPSDSSFQVALTSLIANATGDGTVVSLNASPVTVNFDLGRSVAPSTGVFTAKLSGVYEFAGTLQFSGVTTSDTDAILLLNANGQDYIIARANPSGQAQASNTFLFGGKVKVSLVAGQTAFLKAIVSGSSKTVGIQPGSASNDWTTRFEGSKVQ